MHADGIVFVDADDTLWENYRHFQRVLDRWVHLLAGHGVDAERALATLHATEERNIPLTGYGAAPFVRSVVEAFHLLLPHASHETRTQAAHFAKDAEETIRSHPIELLSGVEEGLARIARKRRVVVLTKGQDDEQRAKVERSGLASVFAGVRVVVEKDVSAYADAAHAFGVPPSSCVMVGNSPRSDVNPALAARFAAIHVPHSAPWHRDVEPLDPRALVAATFADVPSILDSIDF